jgi:hypothetical protein
VIADRPFAVLSRHSVVLVDVKCPGVHMCGHDVIVLELRVARGCLRSRRASHRFGACEL